MADKKLIKRILEYGEKYAAEHPDEHVPVDEKTQEGGYPRNPRDWIYKTPEKHEQQVVMFEIETSTTKIMQLRDNKNRFKVLWQMPFTAGDEMSRRTAMDYASRYARQQKWQIVPYAISSFVGSL